MFLNYGIQGRNEHFSSSQENEHFSSSQENSERVPSKPYYVYKNLDKMMKLNGTHKNYKEKNIKSFKIPSVRIRF